MYLMQLLPELWQIPPECHRTLPELRQMLPPETHLKHNAGPVPLRITLPPERSSVQTLPGFRKNSGRSRTTVSCSTVTTTTGISYWWRRKVMCGWAFPGSMIPVKQEPLNSSVFPSSPVPMQRNWNSARKNETTALTSDTGAVILIRQSVPAEKMKCPDKHISNRPAKGFAYSIPFIC